MKRSISRPGGIKNEKVRIGVFPAGEGISPNKVVLSPAAADRPDVRRDRYALI
jgi:hypothetical protein